MFTAECCGEVMRYLDYTLTEAVYLARKWAGDGNRLAIFSGEDEKIVYDKVVRLHKRK